MNPVFQKILSQYKVGSREFLQWYIQCYGQNNVAIFQHLPFSHQIGVFIEYFETQYKLAIVASYKGFVIHWTDSRNMELDPLNGINYYHHKYTHDEPKSIVYGYELGVLWLFENYDLPF